MKSFKYRGTPEQMAKVAEWALKNGAKWAAGSPADFNWLSETKGFGVVLTETGRLFYIDFYDTAGEPVLELTPALELEIFGSTQNITGNPENKLAEGYFVQPKTEKTLEDAYDSKHTGGSIVWDGVGNMTISGGVMSDAVVPERRSEPRNKYMREIKPGVWVDVYDVIRAFTVTDGALQHLLKKALAVGQRGHKDAATDYKDIVDSAVRAQEIYLEWSV